MIDLYKILGVNSTANNEELKKKYRELAKIYHPDKYTDKNENDKKLLEKKFMEINEAYTILSDSNKRREYDLNLNNIKGKNIKTNLKNKNIYNEFSKGNINDLFGGFFNKTEEKGINENKKMKDQVNNIFDSFFKIKKGGK